MYELLRDRIARGEFPAGTKLPPNTAMAAHFGVAAMTMRQVLLRLQDEGLLSLEQGRGTFVQAPALPGVLIVEDDPDLRQLLAHHVAGAGGHPVEAAGPVAGLAVLENDSTIRVAMTDVRMPDAADGLRFIRTLYDRWPELPVVAVTAYPDDLEALRGRPESPVLVVTKPFLREHVRRALHLAIDSSHRGAPSLPGPDVAADPQRVLVADDDDTIRSVLTEFMTEIGVEADAVADGDAARAAMARRRYSHAFVDLRMPGGGPALPAALAATHPGTTVVVASGHPGDLTSTAGGPFLVLPKPFSFEAVEAIVSRSTHPARRIKEQRVADAPSVTQSSGPAAAG